MSFYHDTLLYECCEIDIGRPESGLKCSRKLTKEASKAHKNSTEQ
jgi:hypothetical protein